jgi:hypothetical protein
MCLVINLKSEANVVWSGVKLIFAFFIDMLTCSTINLCWEYVTMWCHFDFINWVLFNLPYPYIYKYMDIKKILPVFYFHKNEKTFPMDCEKYITKCRLCFGDKNKYEIIASNDKLTTTNIDKFEYFGSKSSLDDKWTLQVVDNNFSDNLIDDAPIYIKEHIRDDGNIEIYVILFFHCSGGYKIFNRTAGYHDADIEHVTILTNKNYEIIKVYFGAHRSKDGMWVDKKDITFENGRPVVYCALNSHAFYPKPITYHRIYFFANDICGKHVKWDATNITLLDSQDWFNYGGFWGNFSVNSMKKKSWFNNETTISTTYFKRLFHI